MLRHVILFSVLLLSHGVLAASNDSHSSALSKAEITKIMHQVMQHKVPKQPRVSLPVDTLLQQKKTANRHIPIGEQTKNWLSIRRALGLRDDDHLYIFVSLSMPDNLLRQYEADAAKAGAALVVRGIPKGMDMKEYIGKRIRGMFGAIGVQAPIQIDPRLFDRYRVDVVPTIVLAKRQVKQRLKCQGFSCKKAPLSSYSSITGSVTLLYALKQFQKHGSLADPFLARFKKQTKEGSKVANGIGKKAFTSSMKKVWKRNGNILAAKIKQDGLEQWLKRYETQFGVAFGPPGMRPGEED